MQRMRKTNPTNECNSDSEEKKYVGLKTHFVGGFDLDVC